MKSILIHLESGPTANGRLQCALDIARAESAHLTCLAVTPLETFVAMDPFGGVYAMPTLLSAVTEIEEQLRTELEVRMASEGVSWNYVHVSGYTPAAIASHARLADLVVLGKPVGHAGREPMALLSEVVLKVSTPVLAVPETAQQFDLFAPAAMGWNGSIESANAVRAALPLLRHASSITVITAEEEKAHDFPDTDVCAYLSRHGLEASIEYLGTDEPNISDALLQKVGEVGAGLFVMGAYGHSRVREYVFGGVTRRMLSDLPVALLMAH